MIAKKVDHGGRIMRVLCCAKPSNIANTETLRQNTTLAMKLVDTVALSLPGMFCETQKKPCQITFKNVHKFQAIFNDDRRGRLLLTAPTFLDSERDAFSDLLNHDSPSSNLLVIEISGVGVYICGIPMGYQPEQPDGISSIDTSDDIDTNCEMTQCNGPNCGFKSEKLQNCSRCSGARYCGKDCQRKDWKRHKPMCQKLSEQHKTWRTETEEKRSCLSNDFSDLCL